MASGSSLYQEGNLTPEAFGGIGNTLDQMNAIAAAAAASATAAAAVTSSKANRAGDTFTGPVTIPFTASGTGAVARTIDAKLKEIEVSAKDFGATGDGSTDDTTALQNAINYAQTNCTGLHIPAGVYRTSATLTISPTYQCAVKIRGDGIDGGTTIKPLHSFSGGYAIKFLGPSSADITVDIGLRDIQVITDLGFGPSVGIGFLGQSGKPVAAYKENPIQDVLIANFPTGLQISNWRLLHFERVGIWSQSVANATGFSILVGTGASDFTGDISWANCLFAAGSGSSYGWSWYNNNSSATIAMAGFKLNRPVTEQATYSYYVNNAGSSQINDIWIVDGQTDGPAGNGLMVDANAAGGSINSIHYVGNYHTALTGHMVDLKDSNGAKIAGVFIERNWSVGGTSQQIILEDGAGGGAANILGVNIGNNVFSDVSSGTTLTDTAIFLNTGTNITATGNQLTRKNAASLFSMFTIGSTVAGGLIVANNAYGYASATGWSATVSNLSASVTVATNIP